MSKKDLLSVFTKNLGWPEDSRIARAELMMHRIASQHSKVAYPLNTSSIKKHLRERFANLQLYHNSLIWNIQQTVSFGEPLPFTGAVTYHDLYLFLLKRGIAPRKLKPLLLRAAEEARGKDHDKHLVLKPASFYESLYHLHPIIGALEEFDTAYRDFGAALTICDHLFKLSPDTGYHPATLSAMTANYDRIMAFDDKSFDAYLAQIPESWELPITFERSLMAYSIPMAFDESGRFVTRTSLQGRPNYNYNSHIALPADTYLLSFQLFYSPHMEPDEEAYLWAYRILNSVKDQVHHEWALLLSDPVTFLRSFVRCFYGEEAHRFSNDQEDQALKVVSSMLKWGKTDTTKFLFDRHAGKSTLAGGFCRKILDFHEHRVEVMAMGMAMQQPEFGQFTPDFDKEKDYRCRIEPMEEHPTDLLSSEAFHAQVESLFTYTMVNSGFTPAPGLNAPAVCFHVSKADVDAAGGVRGYLTDIKPGIVQALRRSLPKGWTLPATLCLLGTSYDLDTRTRAEVLEDL